MVGTECEGHETGADGDCRAAARAAGNERGVEQVAGYAVRRSYADQSGRELVEIGLADDDRAGAPQPRHASRVPCRPVGISFACRGGRQAFDVDVVLDRDRHAMQRQAGAVRRRQRPCFRQSLRLVPQRNEDRRIVMRTNAGVTVRNRVLWRGCARPVRCHDGRGREIHSGPHIVAPCLSSIIAKIPYGCRLLVVGPSPRGPRSQRSYAFRFASAAGCSKRHATVFAPPRLIRAAKASACPQIQIACNPA